MACNVGSMQSNLYINSQASCFLGIELIIYENQIENLHYVQKKIIKYH